MSFFQCILYSGCYRFDRQILICLFKLLVVKNTTLGTETGIQLSPFLVNSVFIRLYGRGCSGPVALAVLAAEWLFCSGRAMVFSVCTVVIHAVKEFLMEWEWCLTYSCVLLSWLLKPFLATSPTLVCHSLIQPDFLLSVLAVEWRRGGFLCLHSCYPCSQAVPWGMVVVALWLSGAF